MKGLVRQEVLEMRAYEDEPQGGLNLMANTNLFGQNPAIERGLAKVRAGGLSEYPSLTSVTLRTAAAKKLGVEEDQVVTGNGSNELIDIVMRTFLEPGDVVAFHTPTFSMVPTFVRSNHGRLHPVPLQDAWQLDVDGLVKARAKVTFLVRPNNPTGNAFPRRDVQRVIDEAAGVVVVDEAYAEFMGGDTFLADASESGSRVIVLRTLSKAHGIAGLRVGYAVASPELSAQMAKIRGPFRLNSVSETIGALALSDDAFVDSVVDSTRREMPNLTRMLEARGFFVYPSDANFVFTRPPVDAQRLAKALAREGVWVRDLGGELAPFLRITVGPPGATARLQAALDLVMPEMTEDSA